LTVLRKSMFQHIAIGTLFLFVGCGAGTSGPQGPEGPPGPSGMTLKDSISCSNVTVGVFNHVIYMFSDGSVMTVCEVGNQDYTVSSTRLHKANQVDATNASCQVGIDWDGSKSYGFWSFVYNGSSSTATYNDPGSPVQGQTRSLTNCTKQ
jgi:hypothetical protein